MTFLRKIILSRDLVRAFEVGVICPLFDFALRYCGASPSPTTPISTTNMSQDYPQLALDDLVHLMSPSPVPQTLQDDSDMPLRTKNTSPEPLPDSDIVHMRRKVTDMHHIHQADAHLTPREEELAEMVRITRVISACSYMTRTPFRRY